MLRCGTAELKRLNRCWALLWCSCLHPQKTLLWETCCNISGKDHVSNFKNVSYITRAVHKEIFVRSSHLLFKENYCTNFLRTAKTLSKECMESNTVTKFSHKPQSCSSSTRATVLLSTETSYICSIVVRAWKDFYSWKHYQWMSSVIDLPVCCYASLASDWR